MQPQHNNSPAVASAGITLGMQFTTMVVPGGTSIPLVMATCAFTTPTLSVPLKSDPVKPNTGAAWREK